MPGGAASASPAAGHGRVAAVLEPPPKWSLLCEVLREVQGLRTRLRSLGRQGGAEEGPQGQEQWKHGVQPHMHGASTHAAGACTSGNDEDAQLVEHACAGPEAAAAAGGTVTGAARRVHGPAAAMASYPISAPGSTPAPGSGYAGDAICLLDDSDDEAPTTAAGADAAGPAGADEDDDVMLERMDPCSLSASERAALAAAGAARVVVVVRETHAARLLHACVRQGEGRAACLGGGRATNIITFSPFLFFISSHSPQWVDGW